MFPDRLLLFGIATSSGATEMEQCDTCLGSLWVREDHLDLPWNECDCGGAGTPCPECNPCDCDHPPKMPPGYVSL